MDYKNKQRQVINHGIHDLTNARLGIQMGVKNMLNSIQENTLTLEELPERFERILKCCDRITKAGDYIYSESKKLREDENN